MTTLSGAVEPSGTVVEARRVVGVGASAGGLESLERLFSHVPRSTGLAFVVVQHLSPDFRSVMDELLARFTPLPVRLAEDGQEVLGDHVYLLPPGKEITIHDGRLRLVDRDPSLGLTLPIDQFLTSLALDQGSRSVAVILSGTGSDGSRGLQKVKRAGGLVVVESPESAKFDGMPSSAIATGDVDHVVEAHEIGAVLLGHPPIRTSPPPVDTSPLDEVFRLLRDQFGLDFSLYKTSTVSRRVLRRVELQASADLREYVQQLRADPQELSSLYRDLLIGVTRFFRDPEAFARLEETAIPEILERVPPGEEIRAWVAGCATGEEAYSLAMILHEQLTAAGRPVHVKILATDVHRASLEHASAGLYGDDQLEHVSEARRKRYFLRRHGRHQVAQEIRQLVVFAPHNVTKDAPFSKMHLVTCRNVLIYFEPLAQRTVLSLFHFGLAQRGILFLGASESPGPLASEFVTLDEHWKIFRKRRDTRLIDAHRLSVLRKVPPSLGATVPPTPTIPSPFGSAPRPSQDVHLLATYDQLLDRYMPPAILVDEDRILVDTFGGADRFLRIGRRRPSIHLLDLVDGELRIALAGAIQRALEGDGAVAYQGVPIEQDGVVRRWTVVAEQFANRRAGGSHVLLSFRDEAEAEAERNAPAWPSARPAEGTLPSDHVRTLEAELAYTRETLQATIEELQTSNEELQATNEELVASNEELQSTNEELHSVNEELYTVNAEYQKKIHELRVLNSDIQHLLEGTEVGTLFLDRQLKIRKFTPRLGKVFRLHEPDLGRDIRDLTHILDRPALFEEIEAVLAGEPAVQADVRDRDGVTWFLRILPYRPGGADPADGHKTEGVVLTLTDISPLERARARVEQLSAIVEQSAEAILGTGLDGRVTAWNAGAERLFGRGTEDAVGRDLARLLPPDREADCRRWLAAVRLGDHVSGGEPVRIGDGADAREVAVTLSPIRGREGEVVGASIVAKDVTLLRKAQHDLAEREARVRQLLDSTAEAILGIGPDGLCTFCNPAAVRLLGFGSPDDLIGRRAVDLARRSAEGAVIRDEEPPLHRVLRTGRGVHADGEHLVRADGSTFPAEYWIHPVRREGRVDGAVLTFLDVTDRKRAEAEILAAARRREQFLAMLSHELRNPLAAVLASTRLLQASGDPDTLARAREVIERQSTHMARLLDDLLDVSRITRGGIELRRTDLDLRAVVTAAIEAVGPLMSHRKADLSVELPEEVVPVNGDVTRLQQVVVNLLSNAARYSPPGSPIRLTLGVDRDRAVVTVADAGFGIEPEALDSIFELFVQGHQGLDRSRGGLGVGLTLVRTIVEQHGGRVEARSDGPGRGSTFTVWLPVDPNALAAARGSERPAGSRRVVLVEDQPDSREMLALLLRRRGHEVVEAADGPSAVEIIARERPDVALVDIGLPLMSGYEVARCLRETRAAVDVMLVALTGYGTAEDVKAAYAAGFDAHLTKPADPEQVEDIVDRARVR